MRHADALVEEPPTAQESIPARQLSILASVVYQQPVDKNIHRFWRRTILLAEIDRRRDAESGTPAGIQPRRLSA
jgi:hypothetical protein